MHKVCGEALEHQKNMAKEGLKHKVAGG